MLKDYRLAILENHFLYVGITTTFFFGITTFLFLVLEKPFLCFGTRKSFFMFCYKKNLFYILVIENFYRDLYNKNEK